MEPKDDPKKVLLQGFGSRSKETHSEKVDGIPDIVLLDLENEEDHDKLAV